MFNEEKLILLRTLPSINKVIDLVVSEKIVKEVPKSVLTSCVKASVEYFRSLILLKDKPFESLNLPLIELIIKDVNCRISSINRPRLRRVINATGIVLHTNLGRSPLAKKILENLTFVSSSYSNLEFDLSKGSRGKRYSIVEPLLCEISGAEAAFVVNNNAAAVLLCLDTIASSKEVIISRGELVEIGGSFRIPDIISKASSIMREVGTTNRTYVDDYVKAIKENTGLLLKVHTSNYGIVGFTVSVSLSELVALGKRKILPVMEDLGSGTFIDFSKYGLLKEPTVQDSIASGVDIVTFSGDKLLGGPQAGIILGKKNYIELISKNPLARALRIDKMTLTALEGTLRFYRDERDAVEKIPVLSMLLEDLNTIAKKTLELRNIIETLAKQFNMKVYIEIFDMPSCAGGGALPLTKFPSKCIGVSIDGVSVNTFKQIMLNSSTPVVGRIENNYYILDLRTISYEEIDLLEIVFKELFLHFSAL